MQYVRFALMVLIVFTWTFCFYFLTKIKMVKVWK